MPDVCTVKGSFCIFFVVVVVNFHQNIFHFFVVVVLFVCVFVLDDGEGRQRKMARYWRIR